MRIIIDNKLFNLKKADNFFIRFIGLMLKKDIKEGLFFPKCNSIHTFFMKESIDIIMTDKDYKVVFFQKGFRKNKIVYKKEAYHTIELPSNSINNLTLGETLIIED